MTHMIVSPRYTPSTPAAEDQSAGVRDPIVDGGSSGSGGSDVSFADLVDVLNPLQHIPLVASLYREITGDDIARGPQVIGDVLFTGPGALVSAGARALFGDPAPATATADGGDKPTGATAEKPLAEMTSPDKETANAAPAPSDRRSNAAALAALARDMRGLPPAPPPADPGTGRPARPAEPDEAAAPPPHANLPPSGASPEWIARAMSRALTKYHSAARTTAPPPHYSATR